MKHLVTGAGLEDFNKAWLDPALQRMRPEGAGGYRDGAREGDRRGRKQSQVPGSG